MYHGCEVVEKRSKLLIEIKGSPSFTIGKRPSTATSCLSNCLSDRQVNQFQAFAKPRKYYCSAQTSVSGSSLCIAT